MADIEKIKVSTSRLSKDSEKVKQGIDNISKKLSEMENSVSELDKMWDGESSEAFKQAFHDDIAIAEKMINNLLNIYQYEQNAAAKYDSCESKVEQLVSGIRV